MAIKAQGRDTMSATERLKGHYPSPGGELEWSPDPTHPIVTLIRLSVRHKGDLPFYWIKETALSLNRKSHKSPSKSSIMRWDVPAKAPTDMAFRIPVWGQSRLEL